MADLKIVADYSDIQVMRRELVGVAKDAKASASVFETAYKKVEAQQKRSLNAVKQQLAFSKRMEAQKTREAKVAAAAAAEVAKEEERLKNKFVEGYTAMNIYSKEMNDLALARKKGLISTKEQTAAVASLNAQMKAGTGAFANAATGMQIVGKRANRTGVLAQQAGYQFGDFAVQVQSGTNPMIAFGQQATQLIGTFSMLARSTKAIMAFSALGVIVPVATAIAGAFMRTRDAAKEAEGGIKTLEEQIKSAKEATVGFKDEVERLNRGLKDVKELALARGVDKAKEALLKAEQDLEKAEVAKGDRSGVLLKNAKIELEVAKKLVTTREQDLATYIQSREEAQKTKDLGDAHVKTYQDYQELLVKVQNSQKGQLELVVAINKYGEDSAKVAELRAKQEGIAKGLVGKTLDEYVAMEMVIRGVVKATEDAADAAGKISPALQSAVDQANAFANAMGRAASNSAGIGISTAGINAQIAALEGGSSKAEATAKGAAATLRAELTAALPSFEAGPRSSASIDRQVQERYSTTLERENARAKLSSMTKSGSSGGGGGSKKSSAEELQEYLDKLQQQADLESQLVGLFGEKRNTEEEVIKARQKYTRFFKTSQEAELRGTLAQIEADKERQRVLEEGKQQQEEVASVIADNFGSAFMSIVDGTKTAKEAFKDMARSIIKQLFQILVVEKMVKSIKSFISPSISAAEANGGAWQGGSKIQAYADGGVVGGPTYFPMAGGKTGLMGEAGPEAIMPLKRGANGKLGVQAEGGGSTTVVQNNTFGSGVTRAEVNAMLPKMVEATKAAVADAKLRGGSYGGAFA